MNDSLIADSFVSLSALGGLLILLSVIRRFDAASPLTRRFAFGLRVLAALMVFRVLAWWTGWYVFTGATVIAAGLAPLATVILAEGLMRRHASRRLKVVAAGGAACFVLLALMPAALVEPWRSNLLFAYQLLVFAMAGHMAVTRDRSSLSRAENLAVDRISLSLLLILPLFATDFRIPSLDTPVRLGGVAILFLCWLLISLGQRAVSHRDTIGSFAALSIAAILGGLVIGVIGDLALRGTVQAIAIVICACLLGVIWKDSITLQAEQRRQTLIRHLAEARIDDPLLFLQDLQHHPLVEGAVLLEEADLGDFDLAALRRLFEARPIIRVADFQTLPEPDREQASWLLETYEATHAMLLSEAPFRLAALTMPSVAATPGAEMELKAVQRMANLIAKTQARRT
jgi:hypothetical protein